MALDQATISLAASFETTLRKITTAEFDTLFKHGYEVADATMFAYRRDRFGSMQYGVDAPPI
jgi:hypothetical protein